MKKIFLSLLAIAIFGSISAQNEDVLLNKMNPAGYAQIKKYEHQLKSRAAGELDDNISIPTEITVFLSTNEGSNTADLEKIPGVKIHTPGKKIMLVTIPLSQIEAVAQSPVTKRMSFGLMAKPMMNDARPASKVTELQNGLNNDLPKNYTGNGVILGMIDEGIDPNHINFQNSDLTENRIKQIWVMPESTNYDDIVSYSTPAQIANFTTDNKEETHATHVAGIMGGAYNGTGYLATGRQNPAVESGNIPYYGVAPDAEMALACGPLYDVNIGNALYEFYNYCQEQGKPGAFNISLGTVIGPHDGTSDLCQYVSQFTDDIIVAISAGNDGSNPISIQKTFASSVDPLQTFLYNGGQRYFSGYLDLWSADSQKFNVSFGIFNMNTGQLVASIPVQSNLPATILYGQGGTPSTDTKGFTQLTSADFATYFTSDSYICFYNTTDANNHRFNSFLDVEITLKNSVNPNYVFPALIITGITNDKVDGYALGTGSELYFYNNGVSGWQSGNADMSINDFACADGVISVGSYITKATWSITGGYGFGYSSATNIGQVSDFTSYGTLPSGETLPNFCAPGQGIASSYNTYYVDYEKDQNIPFYDDGNITLTYPEGSVAYVNRQEIFGPTANRTDYWYISQGTSMSTPYITGLAALLLEQDPTLTSPEIKELLASTADQQTAAGITQAQKTQWGAGKVNALKAMQKLVSGPSALGSVTVDSTDKISVEMTDTQLTASLAGERGLTAHLYSMAGYDVATGNADGDSVTLQIGNLAKGVYILTLQSADGAKISRRVLIGR